MSFPSQLIILLRQVETIDDEILVLGNLLVAISSASESVDQEGNLEQAVKQQISKCSNQPKSASTNSGVSIDDSCTDIDSLQFLVAYVFERRFGWSEGDSSATAAVSDRGAHRLSVVRRSTLAGNISFVEDLRCKSQINEALDKLIAW